MYMPVSSRNTLMEPLHIEISTFTSAPSVILPLYPDKPFFGILDLSSALFLASGSTLNMVRLGVMQHQPEIFLFNSCLRCISNYLDYRTSLSVESY